MLENNLLEKVLRASNLGKDIIVQLYPESASCFGNNHKFRIRGSDVDKTPSAAVKLLTSRSGMQYWGVTDFGGSMQAENAVGLYAAYHQISFSDALKALAEQYHVVLSASYNKPDIKSQPAQPHEPDGRYYHSDKDFTQAELAIWGPFVTVEVLKQYGWHSLLYFSTTRARKTTTVFSNDTYPIFARDCGEFWKVYQPYNPEKAYRFQYQPKEPGKTISVKNLVFGLEQIQEAAKQLKVKSKGERTKLEQVFMCSGERDAMNLAGMGYYPIWFGSETAKLTPTVIKQIEEYATFIYNIPDIDTTGIREGHQKALTFPQIYTIELPQSLKERCDNRGKPCKDFRDYVASFESKEDTLSNFQSRISAALCAQFWFKGSKGWMIRSLNMLYYLRLCGFYKWLEPHSGNYVMVRVQYVTTEKNGVMQVVERLDPMRIREFLRNELRERQLPIEIQEAFLNSKKTSLSRVDDLESIELNFQSATSATKYLFFKNGCYYVDKHTIRTASNPPCCVWKDKIIPHNFKPIPLFWERQEDGSFRYIVHPSHVYRYITNSCRMYWRNELELRDDGNPLYAKKYKFSLYGTRLNEDEIAEQIQYMNSKIFSIGFLMHNYKTDKMAQVLYLLENKNADEDVNAGGSGKSLMIKCFDRMHLLTLDYQDGRDRRLLYNSHYLERVSFTTDIVNFEDLDRSIDLASFYTMVDSGITINPKRKNSYRLPFKEAPNIVFSSNSAPNNLDPSTLRRIRFVQFSDYYHKQTPLTNYKETRKVSDDFDGMELFGPKYTEEMYNEDINFMVGCLQFYLLCISEDNYCEPPMENSIQRMQRQEIGELMYAWFEQYVILHEHTDVLIYKDHAYADYLNFIGPKMTPKTITKFKQSFMRCCEYKGYIFNPEGLSGRNEKARIVRRIYKNGASTSMSEELLYVQTPDAPLNEKFNPNDGIKTA